MMNKWLKYPIRIFLILFFNYIYRNYDATFTYAFIPETGRDWGMTLFFLLYFLLVWEFGGILYRRYKKGRFEDKTMPLLFLYCGFGLFVSFGYSSVYYVLEAYWFKSGYLWTGPVPLIETEMNIGVYLMYLMNVSMVGIIHYYKTLQDEKLLTEKLKRENIQSKYQALKNQIDPHFFFNSLSVLSSLVYKDADLSSDYITKLSKMYRYMLDKDKKSLALLADELKFLDSYIFLMKIRFEDSILFNLDISAESKWASYIPPNTLQMLIENSIKHNKFSNEEPLEIYILEDKENLIVKNNFNKRILLERSSGIGLENIRLRYELLGSKQIKVIQESNYFTVILPKFNEEDYEGIDI